MDKDSSHYCVCPEGHTGSHCEQEMDPCLAQPCQHGGTCRGYTGGYVCEVRSTQGRRWRAGHPECVWLHISVCLEPGAVSLSRHVWVFAFVTLGVSLWVSLWVDLRVSLALPLSFIISWTCVSLCIVSLWV